MAASSSRLRIDASEFARLMNETADVDKRFALDLLQEIRDAAKPITAKMKSAVKDPTSKRSSKIRQVRRKQRSGAEYEVQTHTAELVAAGISFRMNKGKAGVSAVFRGSAAKLPEERKPMARALNKPKFRHPTLGTTTRRTWLRGTVVERPRNKWKWVEQAGRPYFGAVILDDAELIEKAILRAMEKATDRLGSSHSRIR